MTLTQDRPAPHQGKQIKRALNQRLNYAIQGAAADSAVAALLAERGHIMPSRFTTPYDSRRDPFYGLERDPHTGKIEDCRDRD